MEVQYVTIGKTTPSQQDESTLAEKYGALQDYFKQLSSVVIAFSGGVDSTLLVKVAYDTLKDKALAVTAQSSSLATAELEATKKLAREIGIPHHIIKYEELDDENYRKNPTNRCFYCKDILFSKLVELADDKEFTAIVEGSNYDDLGDHRPGLVAAQQLGIKSPLLELGFTKADIRTLSKQLGLETHDKPQMACLSSRIPYGQEITQEKLRRIDHAEAFLHNLGIKQLRVRHHENSARIEVEPRDFETLIKNAAEITQHFKELGFTIVTLDLEGYKRGKMNQ